MALIKLLLLYPIICFNKARNIVELKKDSYYAVFVVILLQRGSQK